MPLDIVDAHERRDAAGRAAKLKSADKEKKQQMPYDELRYRTGYMQWQDLQDVPKRPFLVDFHLKLDIDPDTKQERIHDIVLTDGKHHCMTASAALAYYLTECGFGFSIKKEAENEIKVTGFAQCDGNAACELMESLGLIPDDWLVWMKKKPSFLMSKERSYWANALAFYRGDVMCCHKFEHLIPELEQQSKECRQAGGEPEEEEKSDKSAKS